MGRVCSAAAYAVLGTVKLKKNGIALGYVKYDVLIAPTRPSPMLKMSIFWVVAAMLNR